MFTLCLCGSQLSPQDSKLQRGQAPLTSPTFNKTYSGVLERRGNGDCISLETMTDFLSQFLRLTIHPRRVLVLITRVSIKSPLRY